MLANGRLVCQALFFGSKGPERECRYAKRMRMRNYLTPFLWFEDRLSSLPTTHLVVFSVGCLAALGSVIVQALGLSDDFALLLADDGRDVPLALLGLFLLAAASLWLVSCLLATLGRRLLLRLRGL